MPADSPRHDWSNLIQSLQDEEAVLVLGPDGLPYYHGAEEQTYSQLTRGTIRREVGDGVGHFYERDSLFQFADARSKQAARKSLRQLARQEDWLPDDELLRQIVSLPFSVILNLNPDRRVFDAFVKYWKEPQFDYFTTRDKPKLFNLSYPSTEQPLLYNLTGSVTDKMDSVVLDYNDLFSLLKNLLSDHGVPEVLTQKLNEVDNFVLLGVELERWYLQMLIHYINQLDSPFSNYNQTHPILCELSEDSRQFIIKQFNITHQSLSREDFGHIHAAAEQAGILRDLISPGSKKSQDIRQLIITEKYGQVFKELAAARGAENAAIDIPLLHARYNTYLEKQRNNLLSDREAEFELNRIRYALLSFTAQIS